MAVPNGRTAVRKSTLFEGELRVADTVRAFSGLHEEKKLVEVMLRLTVRFDVRLSLSPDVLLDAMTLDRLACLLLNVSSGTVLEVILAAFFGDLLFAVRPLRSDYVGELSDLFLVLMTLDAVLAPLQLCALFSKLDDFRIWCQVGPD
uniref:Uncharacterized protein n=1 Tax=Fusarium oxysporum (strain Fo5176) TaxID=660025 RepID=A0A0D2Y8I0_FUSOF